MSQLNPFRCLVVCLAAALSVALATPAPAAERKLREPTAAELQQIEAALPQKATARPAKPRKLFIFTRTEGFTHSSIMYAARAVEMMGRKTGAFRSVISDDMAMFDPDTIGQFDAIFFDNTTGLKFMDENKKPDLKRRQALLDFVDGGKGVIGNHGAVDNFRQWPEGAALIGAIFAGHPWGHVPVKLDDPEHPLLKVFGGKGFWIKDEMYKMGGPYSREKLRVLLSFDMGKLPNDAKGREDKDNAVAWIQQVGKGRVFYCSLGHAHNIFWNETILQFYLDGIQYALGDLKADATPSAKLSPQPTPVLAPEKP